MLVIAVGLAASSCAEWAPDPDGLTEQDRVVLEAMKAPLVAADTSNPVLADPRAQALGQALFFDPELSGQLKRGLPDQQVYLGGAGAGGRLACVDCHAPTGYFDDNRSTPSNVSLGIDFTSRNSPSMVNVAFYQSWAWDGRSDSLWMQCGVAHEAPGAMGGSRLQLARVLSAKYAAPYEEIFGDAGFPRLTRVGAEDTEFDFADGGKPFGASADYLNRIAANSYKAMAAYLSQLVSVDSPFDTYLADGGELSLEARRGLKVFLGRAGCIECHRGPNFTDNQFHSVGVAQRGEHVPLPAKEQGRFDGLGVLMASAFNRCGKYTDRTQAACSIPDAGEADRGMFRTKSLRNIGRTSPYMHAGQLPTLEAVVRFYNAGGDATGFTGTRSRQVVPLGLSEAEIFDLVAFLNSLTGTPVPARLGCDPTSAIDSDGGTRDGGAHRYAACPGGGR